MTFKRFLKAYYSFQNMYQDVFNRVNDFLKYVEIFGYVLDDDSKYKINRDNFILVGGAAVAIRGGPNNPNDIDLICTGFDLDKLRFDSKLNIYSNFSPLRKWVNYNGIAFDLVSSEIRDIIFPEKSDEFDELGFGDNAIRVRPLRLLLSDMEVHKKRCPKQKDLNKYDERIEWIKQQHI